MIKKIVCAAGALIFSTNVLAEKNYQWLFLVLNSDTKQSLSNVPVQCVFTDHMSGGLQSKSNCITDADGRCSITSTATSSFFSGSSQSAECTPVVAGFAREFTYTTKKIGEATEIAFSVVPGKIGNRFKPDFYRNDIKTIDDDLDVVARLVSPLITQKGVDMTVRSFINKRTGKTEYQLYAEISYNDERRRYFNLANGATKEGAEPLTVRQIDYQTNCKKSETVFGLCKYTEILGIDLSELIPELVASNSTEEERAWRIRFIAKTGEKIDAEIPNAVFVAISDETRLRADKFKQKIKKSN